MLSGSLFFHREKLYPLADKHFKTNNSINVAIYRISLHEANLYALFSSALSYSFRIGKSLCTVMRTLKKNIWRANGVKLCSGGKELVSIIECVGRNFYFPNIVECMNNSHGLTEM